MVLAVSLGVAEREDCGVESAGWWPGGRGAGPLPCVGLPPSDHRSSSLEVLWPLSGERALQPALEEEAEVGLPWPAVTLSASSVHVSVRCLRESSSDSAELTITASPLLSLRPLSRLELPRCCRLSARRPSVGVPPLTAISDSSVELREVRWDTVPMLSNPWSVSVELA